jgi:hypothetical protein
MKTKNTLLLFSIIITFISLPIQAAVHAIDQTQPILLTTGYVDNMNEEWDVTSTVTNQPLKITYSTSTETSFDFVTIYSVDNSGNATLLVSLTGIQSGSITTLIPNGKAKIVFTSDGSVCYPTYGGLNISFAVDNPLVVSSNINVTGNAFINGYLGVGTPSVTKKFEVWDGNAGRFTFSAAGCTSGYEIAQTIDNTGYRLNVNSTIRNYKVATNGADRLTITNTGLVGLGTTAPSQALSLTGRMAIAPSGTGSDEGYNGDLMITKPLASGQYINLVRTGIVPWSIGTVYNSSTFAIGVGTSSDAAFTHPFFNIDINGNVGIATTIPDSKLTVNGTIHATEVKVDLTVPADYVFKSDYKLMPLNEVEKYVKTNSHLPEIPSAEEITKNGLKMGEMQNKLLQKVEELTLYMIEQQKTINQQSAKIEELEKKLK